MPTKTGLEYEDLPIANPSDHDWTHGLYRMWADAYGSTKAYVWANSFEDAAETFFDWLDDNAPGCLTTIDYEAAAQELYGRPMSELGDDERDAAAQEAEVDMTVIGHTRLNNGNAIPSSEWGGDEMINDKLINYVAKLSS